MYIYIYIHIYIYIYIYIYICIYTYTYTYTYTYMYIHIYIYTYIYLNHYISRCFNLHRMPPKIPSHHGFRWPTEPWAFSSCLAPAVPSISILSHAGKRCSALDFDKWILMAGSMKNGVFTRGIKHQK